MIDLRVYAAAAVFALGAPLAAQATTLTFDLNPGPVDRQVPGNYGDNVSGTDTDVDGSGAAAAGSYGAEGGFTPNVSVSYDGVDPQIWTNGYGDLENVYFIEPDGTDGFGLTLTAESGFEAILSSFEMGNFGGEVVLPSIQIFVDMVLEYSAFDVVLPAGSTDSHLDFDDLGLQGEEISLWVDLTGLGGSSDNVGIDNVVFGQVEIAPVPLPAGLPLMLAGLGVFGLMRRRKS